MKSKDQLHLEEAYTNIVKENLKTFEVWLDRPGNSWSETVRAKTPEQAKKIASKTHSSEMNGAEVREVLPQNTQSDISEPSLNLYTDILNPLHMIIGDADHVDSALSNVDELLEFLIKKNPSIQNDILEYIRSKHSQYNSHDDIK